jgi:general stress protein CsbA
MSDTCNFLSPTDDYPHCCRVGNIVTVFLKSVACPVSKCILIGLFSVDTVNREVFLFFFGVLLGRSFFTDAFSVFFLCTFGARFFTAVYVVLLSTLFLRQCFTGQEWVKSVKFQFKLWMWNNALSPTYALVVL